VGCGTGQESVGLGLLFGNVDILAVDLSLASLAYASRKTRELGLDNIAYGQADLLLLPGLGRQFDIAFCAGVLHHLEDSIQGWRAVAEIVKPGGAMLIGLYSQLGRQDLVPVKAFAKERGYGVSNSELRRFRKDVYAQEPGVGWRGTLLAREDFYNLSMLRDLVFHVQEHRFTLAEIESAIAQLGLVFGGFGVEPHVRRDFLARFGANADQLSFDLWSQFETENPTVFSGMYHFLVQKPA
jgi:ubiquinone/menaquinone biosynthesis C-methylase UbiE